MPEWPDDFEVPAGSVVGQDPTGGETHSYKDPEKVADDTNLPLPDKEYLPGMLSLRCTAFSIQGHEFLIQIAKQIEKNKTVLYIEKHGQIVVADIKRRNKRGNESRSLQGLWLSIGHLIGFVC